MKTDRQRLPSGLFLLAVLACGAQAPLPASVPDEPTLSGSLLDAFKWSFDGQAFAYGTVLARTPDSLLNPGNAYAKLPNLTLTGEVRPNVHATSQYIDMVLQPRFTSVFQDGGVEQRESVRAFIQQGYIRARPDDNVSVTVGRDLLTWGPAFFRSPSNPYYFDNARLDPIKELSGIDLAQISYDIDSNWRLAASIVFDSGQDLVPGDPYRGSLLAKLDYRGNNYLGSVIVASLRSEQTFFGGYAQATVNDAILLYGEFGTTSSNTGLATLPSGSTGWFSPDTNGRREATTLAGGSYTFGNGQSINAEYLYNGFGYDGAGLRNYFHQSGLAGSQLALGGSLAGLAGENVGLAVTRSQSLLGQHYLYLQYQNSPTDGETIWRLMAAQNLVDHSAQLSAYIEHNLTNHVSVFGLGVVNVGPRDTEYAAVFGESLMVGFKFYLF